ncbi:hypothetical protein N658DRAFT_561920 [Parathielavia hyrcaniae]|uniref:Uncharacterized protein n=1 Tax=Parathielavia hyrcaniae TaxID=113614 RepID=A0AAN6SXR2_9PEZI|nr:hypothetical protein N658DRAFT_561920 [Parathielavia hyrcaniae]
MAFSWQLIIISGFAVASLTANIVFLIGGMTPTTKDIALYRVNVTLLADGLQKLALLDSGHAADLPRAELPTYWYWGMSGICDVFQETGKTRCRRAFPPTQNLLGVLEESLRDRLSSDQEQLTNDTVASWRTALDNIDPSRLVDKEAKYAGQLKASVALAILACILNCATPLLAWWLLRRSTTWPSYILSLVSHVIAIVAGALALLAMRDGMHPLLDTSEHAGLAILVLFVGAGLPLAVPIIAVLLLCVLGVLSSSDSGRIDLVHKNRRLGTYRLNRV